MLKSTAPKEGSVKPTANHEDKESDALGDDSPTVKPQGEASHGAEGISSAKGVIKSAKKSAGKETANTADNASKKSKKRKADMEGDKEPKKKKLKKDEPPKPKVPKPKGPVDVEKQCGVLLPNGGYCARSLTCKSHSMGAKRAVPGRSMPYDFLLAQYQKKNQAKQQSKFLIIAQSIPYHTRYNSPFYKTSITVHHAFTTFNISSSSLSLWPYKSRTYIPSSTSSHLIHRNKLTNPPSSIRNRSSNGRQRPPSRRHRRPRPRRFRRRKRRRHGRHCSFPPATPSPTRPHQSPAQTPADPREGSIGAGLSGK